MNRANAGRTMVRRSLPVAAMALAVSVAARPAHAADPVASFHSLVTGNGHGFQVFDVSANAITQYLERPYRFLRANPSNPDGDGIVRRDLAYDTYFGVRAGGTSVWLGGKTAREVGYVEQSNMIRSVVDAAGLSTESFFVAPFGYEGNALVMLLKVTNTAASAQTVSAFTIHNFKMGTAWNPDAPGEDGEAIQWDGAAATETGPGGGALVYVPIGGADVSTCDGNAWTTVGAGGTLTPQASCTGSDLKNAFEKDFGSIAPGESRWWGVAILFDADGNRDAAKAAWSAFLGGKTPDQLYASVLADVESWRTSPPPGMSAAETAVWRQAEMVLRMAQIRESWSDEPRRKNHGMVLASLPPGGWHVGWVRDATYALVALARSGHGDEAKAGLSFFLNADAGRYSSFLAGVPYRVSTVRYYGDGQEEADYSGAPTRNIEIDGWGLALWAARQYVDTSGDVAWLDETTRKGDSVYDALKNGVADALVANLESSGVAIADASIWEVHWGNRQHFLYTTAAAARGLCDMATLARRAGRTQDVEYFRGLADKVRTAMTASFVDDSGVLAGSLERLASGANYRDGATVEALTWNLVPSDDPIATATLGGLSHLQTPAGGYKRVEGSSDPYDTDEWLLVDLRASSAFRRAGNTSRADQLLAWVTAQAAANYDLIPELFNTSTSSGPIGAYAGSIPMVGFGAGAYQLTMLDRAQLDEHTDCGEKDIHDYVDAGATSGDAGPGGGLGDRSGVGCACNGGPGTGSTGALLGLVGLITLRRRRRP